MKKILFSFFRQFLFWILFFNIIRIVFLLYFIPLLRVEGINLWETISLFKHSFRLDLAVACYFMVIPFVILLIQSLWSPKGLNTINKAYAGATIFCYSLLGAGEMGIYPEWKTKLTYKVIKYLNHPAEIYLSAGPVTFYLLLFLFLIMFLGGLISYLRFFYRDIIRIRRDFRFTVVFLISTAPLLFVGMRGGIQPIPVNQSQSYYSHHNILNLAAVNNAFNLYVSIFENFTNYNRNPYVFMPPELSSNMVRKIYHSPKDSVVRILNISRPNIVLLILESWSADLIESLGGKPGITPEFRKLEEGGVLFSQIYAAGPRSEQGLASIFSGFPAHPISCITVQPDKFVKLPSLVKNLESVGYSSAFYFGGQLIYGNIKSYIFFNGFDKIMEVYDFPTSYPRGELGIHDQYTLDYLLQDLQSFKEPFFAALFTISTHAPWDQPYEKPLHWGDNEQEYINAAYYTDHCLGEFFQAARNQSWYDSALFIIIADHSHNSYRNWHPQSREYRLIPLLFYGNVINPAFRGTIWPKIGNQHDLPATVLAQLGLPYKEFHWSKNMLNPYVPEFAYYSTEDGLGWIRYYAYYTWDAGPDYLYWSWFITEEVKDTVMLEGKAYLQEVFKEYMEK
jgi:phosphoglycerol transferase MdoB-like AlkP superfamily enzyme